MLHEYASQHSGVAGFEGIVPVKIGGCLFVGVPSELRDAQARGLHDSIAARLAREDNIRGLVLDVSSLMLVDSYAAKVLEETARVAQAFGARAVIVGIRPPVAITLVELGIDFAQIATALNLEDALAKLKLRVVEVP